MSMKNVAPKDVECQTDIVVKGHFVQPSEHSLVRRNIGCQTEVVFGLEFGTPLLYESLRYIDPLVLTWNCQRQIELFRHRRLRWNLPSDEIKTNCSSVIDYDTIGSLSNVSLPSLLSICSSLSDETLENLQKEIDTQEEEDFEVHVYSASLARKGALRKSSTVTHLVVHHIVRQLIDEVTGFEKPKRKAIGNKMYEEEDEESMVADDEGPSGTTESACQTDLSVHPHVLDAGIAANIFTEMGMQTSVTCVPTASNSSVVPKLSEYRSHHGLEVSTPTPQQLDITVYRDSEPKQRLENAGSDHAGKLGMYLTEAEIQRRINECETPMERQLLFAMSTTMRALSSELNSLKLMYEQFIIERPDEPKGVTDTWEPLPQIKDDKEHEDEYRVSELVKYEMDLITGDADEFPFAVIITNEEVISKEHDIIDEVPPEHSRRKSSSPAIDIAKFNNVNFIGSNASIGPMYDYDLSGGIKMPDYSYIFQQDDGLELIQPMYDSDLKGGQVGVQLGKVRRVDFSIFLEDYRPKPMLDINLTNGSRVEVTKDTEDTEASIPPPMPANTPKGMLDSDLGKPPALTDMSAVQMNCSCNEIPDPFCVCGCHDPHVELDEDSSDEDSMYQECSQRPMFDYDLHGGVKPKIRREPEPFVNPLMFDTDLLFTFDRSLDVECICIKEMMPECKCSCDDMVTAPRPPSGEYLDDQGRSMPQAMFDFDLTRSRLEMKGPRVMFDTDLDFSVTPNDYDDVCICCEQMMPECTCSCAGIVPDAGACNFSTETSQPLPMRDYDLKGELIGKPAPLPASDRTKFCRAKGVRGMFDFDLDFEIDGDRPEVECICVDQMMPECLCSCAGSDFRVASSTSCNFETGPKPMWDSDIGRNFVAEEPKQKKQTSSPPPSPSLPTSTLLPLPPPPLPEKEEEDDSDYWGDSEEASDQLNLCY